MDASNKRLLTIILRQVIDELEIKEYFLSFYSLDNIKLDYIVKYIIVSFIELFFHRESNFFSFLNLQIKGYLA